MWTWTLNWNEIRHDLVIGACPMTTGDIDTIHHETGATALLSVQSDACRSALDIDYEEHRSHGRRTGVVLVNSPMRDFDPADQRRCLAQALASLHNLLRERHKVYVHCTAGINRSPLTVLAYLSFVEAMPKEAAHELILRGRPRAEPYWEAYDGCHEDLVATYRADIEHRAFEISERHPENTPERNWRQAERQVFRAAFVGSLASPLRQLHPHRP